jgi:hypothetical protein
MYAKAPQSQAEHEELQTEQNDHGPAHNLEAYHAEQALLEGLDITNVRHGNINIL